MKNLIVLSLFLIFSITSHTAEAQRNKAQAVRTARVKSVNAHRAKKRAVTARRANRVRAKRTRVVHYHYRNLPRRGAVVTTVHTNALTIRFNGIGFRYHAGVWYQPAGAKWRVIRPARGIRIRTLPVGYRKVVVGPRTYFYYYGTYYVQQGNEYEVVDTPVGAEVDSLPEGYETHVVDGEEYYELDDTFYMPSINDEGEEILVAIPDPTK